jgi:hypothetical protein
VSAVTTWRRPRSARSLGRLGCNGLCGAGSRSIKRSRKPAADAPIAFVVGLRYGRVLSNGRSMNDFRRLAFLWSAGLPALLLLAIGPALDGAGLAEASGVPVLMAVWGVVVLIDRWVVGPR